MSKHPIALNDEERTTLRRLIGSGIAPARTLTRARVLLKAEQGLGDAAIADALEISVPTAWRIRRRFLAEGLDSALAHKHPAHLRSPRLDGRAEAHLVTLACSTPPEGHARWSLRLLAATLVELDLVPHISPETVRKTLKKTSLRRT
jgi:Homeodomain-like domain